MLLFAAYAYYIIIRTPPLSDVQGRRFLLIL